MPRYDEAWIVGMLGAERAAASPPEQLLDLAAVRAGDHVADVGCGPGFLTFPAARRAGPEGLVWALDTAPEMTRYVAERAAREGIINVRPLLVESPALLLRDEAADVAFCSLVLHDLDPAGRQELARELARILRPEGRLLVVEWQPRPNDQRANRLDSATIVRVLTAAGLVLTATPTDLGAIPRPGGAEGMYAVVARKAAPAKRASGNRHSPSDVGTTLR